MKKLTIISVLLFIGLIGYSQLNGNASYLRDNAPELYKHIRMQATDRWQEDNSMIVYTINNQSDAVYEIQMYLDQITDDELIRFYDKWANYIEGELCIDYSMVLYEIKKHIENSDY